MAIDRILHKKWYQTRAAGWILGSCTAMAALAIAVFVLLGDTATRVDAAHVTIAPVFRDVFQTSLTVTATVVPARTVYLDAIEGGRVEELFVESGVPVEAGDTLLRLSNASLVLDIIDREAQLTEQRNNLRNSRLALARNTLTLRSELLSADLRLAEARRDFELRRRLYEQKQVSENEFVTARDRYDNYSTLHQLAADAILQDSLFRSAQVDALEESVERIDANLAIVRRNLDNLVIRAPISGLLTALNAERGESKSPGERIGQIDMVDGFKLRAEVDEYYLARIEPGRTAEFTLLNQTHTATLNKIDPQVREGRFLVEFALSGVAPNDLRRGQTVHLQLALDDADEALLLARGAFHQTTAGQWAFVVDADGRQAVRRPIRLGRQNSHHFEVLEGLEEGERVIVSSYNAFAEATELMLTNN